MRLLEKSNTLKVLNSIKESGDLYIGKELNDVANWIYKNANRDSEWDKFTDEELIELISFCCITDKNPGGRAYDDEVFDAADRRPNGEELIKKGQLMAVGGDASKLKESEEVNHNAKYKVGDKVLYSGDAVEVLRVKDDPRYGVEYLIRGDSGNVWADESWLSDASVEPKKNQDFIDKFKSIFRVEPIIREDGSIFIDNIKLRGSGLNKGICAVYTPHCLKVYNEEWGFFVYNGEVDKSSMENMSQYWFYDDYENNEEFRNRIDTSAKNLYNSIEKLSKNTVNESVETFTDHTGKFDHDWFMNEVKLHIDNTYDVYEAACDKSRPAEAVANLAIQSAVNTCEPKPITWGQIKSRINKLGGDFEKVKADSIQAVEDFRKEMDEENALNESAKPMLSDKDKELLLKWGYPESDFRQIADAIRVSKYTLIDKDGKERKISSEEARKMLGDEEFLSGISRSAFHWTAMRGTEDRGIYFDSSKLFESAKKLNESSDDLMWTSDSYAWVYDESDDAIMSEYKDATGEDAESADQAREYFFNDEFAWEVDKEDWDLNILPMIKEQTVNDIVILSGSIGLWHGNYSGGKVVDVNDLLDSMGDVDVVELHCDKNTDQLYLEGHHHDGTHSMYLYTIPKEQDKQLEFLNALGVIEWLNSIYDYDVNNYTAEEDALSRLSSAKELDDVIDSRGGFGDAMKLATPIVNNLN